MVSPLNPDAFAHELTGHSNQSKVSFILEGLWCGFRLGFQRGLRLKPVKCNKPSAFQHLPVMDEYLATRVLFTRVTGPFCMPPILNFHVSSFRVIPKYGQPGKRRFIMISQLPKVLV